MGVALAAIIDRLTFAGNILETGTHFLPTRPRPVGGRALSRHCRWGLIDLAVFETPDELHSLQVLLDTSLADSSSHLRSIIRPGESTLDAERVVRVCQGMCTLAIATVTRRGEPRISGADGHLLHGRWIVGTHRQAAKARHLAARPGISATFMRGEQLVIFTHGHAVPLNPEGTSSDPTLAGNPRLPRQPLRRRQR